MKSTAGRPRALTDARVAEILEWHRKNRSRKKLRDVARENNVSTQTILNVIRRGGRYKQVSPDMRKAAIAERRRVLGKRRACQFV
jgi:erythromycin esterase-like protein